MTRIVPNDMTNLPVPVCGRALAAFSTTPTTATPKSSIAET